MGLRPAKCYSQTRGKPYTRKDYMRGIPGSKITIFDMGEQKNYSHKVHLVADENCRIRHNALESARIITNKYLTNKIGRANYYFKVRVYPHHVIRENKMATGAGADRFQQGMRKAFGKPVGTAAIVREGQKVFTVNVNKQNIDKVKKALNRAKMKFPMPCTIEMN